MQCRCRYRPGTYIHIVYTILELSWGELVKRCNENGLRKKVTYVIFRFMWYFLSLHFPLKYMDETISKIFNYPGVVANNKKTRYKVYTRLTTYVLLPKLPAHRTGADLQMPSWVFARWWHSLPTALGRQTYLQYAWVGIHSKIVR